MRDLIIGSLFDISSTSSRYPSPSWFQQATEPTTEGPRLYPLDDVKKQDSSDV
jgi:hypothetical protein